MNILRRYIALLLACIFAFPILYAPVHSVRHLSETQDCTHIVEHSRDSDEVSTQNEHTECYICNYKFATQKLEDAVLFSCTVYSKRHVFSQAQSSVHIVFGPSSHSPRGPPSLASV